jgi:hypothetical protein
VPKIPSASTLSLPRRRLLALLQRVNYGRIEHLVVRGGEPVLGPRPRVVVEYKFGGENGPRPEARATDFALKAQHLSLLALLDRIGDGVIPLLVAKGGLPFHADIPE